MTESKLAKVPRPDKIKVLVVDDERMILDMVQLALINSGISRTISRAANGQEAWNKIVDHRHDILIIDINMPKLNGVELVTKCRELVNYKPKILISSGAIDRENLEQLKNLGVMGFITKPYNSNDLVKRIQAIIKTPH